MSADHPAVAAKAAADESGEDKKAAAPVTRLYRHALECVFGFVALADLSRVLAVSQAWAAAVRSMKPIDAAVDSERALPGMIAASPLASHVRHFGSKDAPLVISSSDLLLLSRHPISLL